MTIRPRFDRARVLCFVVALALTLVYFAGQRRNPPGFYVDESSVAYNAFTIAERGADEYGYRFPLYFRAFGEYKNPLYVYLLAAVFKVAGPGILTARRLSALLGWLAALVMGGMAWWGSVEDRRPRLSGSRDGADQSAGTLAPRSGQRMVLSEAKDRVRGVAPAWIALATFALTLFTPMLFEISRLAFEVAAFPLAVALFLYFARRAATSERWPPSVVAGLAISLACATYAYTAGRVLAPAFLLLLFLFYTRQRRSQLAAVVALYALVTIVPLAIYESRNPGALSERAKGTSYLNNWRADPLATLLKLEQQTLANLAPLGMSLRGDPNPRHHVPRSGGSILAMTFVLAALGLRRDRWTLFLVLGALLSIAPGAATEDVFHTLRLAAFPLFLIALSVEGLQRRPRLASAAFVLAMAQACFFLAVFHWHGGERGGHFDEDARIVMTGAMRRGKRPIYAHNLGSSYAHAYWYGALYGVRREAFRPYPAEGTPPPGSLVVAIGGPCEGCTVVSRSGGYVAYLQR